MEDIDDDGRGGKTSPENEERILCTTELGLQRLEKAEGVQDSKEAARLMVMLKTKVQLKI